MDLFYGNFSLRWDSVIYGESLGIQESASLYNGENFNGEVTFYGVNNDYGIVIFSEHTGPQILGGNFVNPGWTQSVVTSDEVFQGFDYNIQISYESFGNSVITSVEQGTLTNFDGYTFEVGDVFNIEMPYSPFAGTFQYGSDIFLVFQNDGESYAYGMVTDPDTFVPPASLPLLDTNPYTVPSLQGPRLATPGAERAMDEPLEYIASYADLRLAFGTDATAGREHFI